MLADVADQFASDGHLPSDGDFASDDNFARSSSVVQRGAVSAIHDGAVSAWAPCNRPYLVVRSPFLRRLTNVYWMGATDRNFLSVSSRILRLVRFADQISWHWRLAPAPFFFCR